MWPGCSRDLADTTQAGLHVRGAKRRSGALLALRQAAGGRLDGDCFRLWCRRGSRCALLAAAATLALAIDERRAPIQCGGRLLRGGKVRLSTHSSVVMGQGGRLAPRDSTSRQQEPHRHSKCKARCAWVSSVWVGVGAGVGWGWVRGGLGRLPGQQPLLVQGVEAGEQVDGDVRVLCRVGHLLRISPHISAYLPTSPSVCRVGHLLRISPHISPHLRTSP